AIDPRPRACFDPASPTGAPMVETFFREEHQIFRRTVADFVAKELAPHADEWERAQSFPREVFAKCGQLGLLGPHYPESVGGGGGDYWYSVVWGEELAGCNSNGVAMALMVQTDMATPIIGELGSDEQKREFLAPAIRGEKIAALGISEPGCGSD